MRTASPVWLEAAPDQGRLEQLFIWAGGYSPRNLVNESPERREHIGKLGGTVFFAAFVAAINWVTAGWVFTEGAPFGARVACGVLAGLIAIMMVLVIDRGTLYFLDTMPQGGRIVFVWVMLRATVIFAVSTITAQAVMPVVLGSELLAHALRMQENSEARRITELRNRYQLTDKDNAVATAKAEAGRLQIELGLLPPNIQSHLADVRRCWAAYGTRKSSLTSAGILEVDARSILKIAAGRCASKQSVALKEKEAYETKTQSLYQDALDRKAAADADLATATATVSARVELAHNIEKEAITPRSASVLADLLAKDSGAKAKWAFITFGLMIMEMLPLFTKFLARKSTIGLRISTDRTIDAITQHERITARRHDAAVAQGLGESMQEAVLIACKNSETRQFCAALFGRKIAAFLPFEAVNALLHEIESKQIDIDRAMRRYPKYATALSQAWSQTLQETVDLLKTETPLRRNSPGVQNLNMNAHAANQQHPRAA